HTLPVGGAWLADARVCENTVTAVQPAIRAPAESVERLVRVLPAPAVEQHLRRTGWFVLAVLDRHKQEVRRRPDPDAAKADFETADQVQVLHEHGALVKGAGAGGVLEDDDAVLRLRLGAANGVAVGLGHPNTAAVVQTKRDWLMDVGLPG